MHIVAFGLCHHGDMGSLKKNGMVYTGLAHAEPGMGRGTSPCGNHHFVFLSDSFGLAIETG